MSNTHLIRMAGRIHRVLSQSANQPDDWGRAVSELISRLRSMERSWQLSQEARIRGWTAAGAWKSQQVLADALRVESAVTHLQYQSPPGSTKFSAPSLRTVIEELVQLHDEFETVVIDLQHGVVCVSTDAIILEDINLGPFSIELHVGRLSDHLGSDSFKCIALKPNPAVSREDTVHPHVQDGHLCAGDAATPIASALKDGRIADAFVLIRSVLQTYNEDSPYISLNNWSGRTCNECGDLADSDYMHFCEGCEEDVCENCYSSCDMCDQGRCCNCLERDTVSGNRCCAGCRHTCAACNRIVDEESFDAETGLCPGCLAEHLTNQEQENSNENESDSESVDSATDAQTTPSIPAAA